MTNPYAMGGVYPNQGVYPQDYSPIYQKKSNGLPVLGIATVGGLGAGVVGYMKNRLPVSKDGVVSDSFARAAFDKHIDKNLSNDGKEFFKQVKNIMDKIDSIKTPEQLKKLLKENKAISESKLNGFSLDTLLETVNADNIKSKKETLKKSIQAIDDYNIENMKEAIKACWDSDSKKFVKPDSMKENLFNIIKKTNKTDAWKKALKYGGITAAITGGLAILYNIFTNKK